MADLDKRAKEIIEKITYCSVATVDGDGNPWNAPVFVAHDADYNFYWGTYRGSQKSKNIGANGKVFLTIYDSTAAPGQGEGVYIQGKARELTNPEEIARAHQLLWDRHVVPYWKLEQVQGDAPIRLFKTIPQKVWMNGEGRENGHYIDTRIEVSLAE